MSIHYDNFGGYHTDYIDHNKPIEIEIEIPTKARYVEDTDIYITYGDDEYYYITLSIGQVRESISTHFKCDQLVGLLHFICDCTSGKYYSKWVDDITDARW